MPQPEIHVTHDRKQHHAPAPVTAILKSRHPAANLLRAGAEMTSVVSLTRATSPRPQLPLVADEVLSPTILPTLDDKRRTVANPAPLRGSHEILLHQNEMAEQDGLDRVQDDADLLNMRASHLLVPLPNTAALVTDERLPYNRRFVRPWTAQFLTDLAKAHYARFYTPLQVNSAVRTVAFQQHLIHVNGNAAPADGDTASPHLTGQAFDLAKHGLTAAEIAWLRTYLMPVIGEGKIDVEEEFQQACFHISVYKSYSPGLAQPEIQTTHRGSGSALALVMR